MPKTDTLAKRAACERETNISMEQGINKKADSTKTEPATNGIFRKETLEAAYLDLLGLGRVGLRQADREDAVLQ